MSESGKNTGELYFLHQKSDRYKGLKQCEELRQINYDCCITNNILKTSITQVFENNNPLSLEAVYYLHLEENSCLDSFTAQYENTLIKGLIKSKTQAKKEYQESVDQGDIVVYADLEKVNEKFQDYKILTFNLGNIPQNCQLKITVVIIEQAKQYLNRYYTVSIPLARSLVKNNKPSEVLQKFLSRLPKDISQQILESKKINEMTTSYFKLDLFTTDRIITAEANNLSINEQIIDSNHYTFSLQEQPNRDDIFQLYYQYGGMFEPQVIYGANQIFHEDTVKQAIMPIRKSIMVSFLPDFNKNNKELIESEVYSQNMIGDSILDQNFILNLKSQLKSNDNIEASKSEFIFFLDRSGSMSGKPIEQAKQSLLLFLKSLPMDSYFNVISFGSNFQFMFQESQKYSQKSLQDAIEQISKFDASMGGTNVINPLQQLLISQKKIKCYNRQIFLLTDGQVKDFQIVVDLIKKYNKYNRIHAIGIGYDVSEKQIEGIAIAGKGQKSIIKQTNRLSEEIINILHQSISPALDNFQLDYDVSIFESLNYPLLEFPFILKEEIFTMHLFLKQGIELELLTEKQKTLSLSYFDSNTNQQVNKKIILNPMDVFAANNEVKQQIFKLGMQYFLNEAINLGILSEETIVNICTDHQILTTKSAIICAVEKVNDEKKQYYQHIQQNHFNLDSFGNQLNDQPQKAANINARHPSSQSSLFYSLNSYNSLLWGDRNNLMNCQTVHSIVTNEKQCNSAYEQNGNISFKLQFECQYLSFQLQQSIKTFNIKQRNLIDQKLIKKQRKQPNQQLDKQ